MLILPLPLTGYRCESITSEICKQVGFRRTSFPNYFGHYTQEDALKEMNNFTENMPLNCSPYITKFLCSIFFPKCSIDRLSRPCQSFCEHVKGDCKNKIKGYGIQWPDMFNCWRFSDADGCYAPLIQGEHQMNHPFYPGFFEQLIQLFSERFNFFHKSLSWHIYCSSFKYSIWRHYDKKQQQPLIAFMFVTPTYYNPVRLLEFYMKS